MVVYSAAQYTDCLENLTTPLKQVYFQYYGVVPASRPTQCGNLLHEKYWPGFFVHGRIKASWGLEWWFLRVLKTLTIPTLVTRCGSWFGTFGDQIFSHCILNQYNTYINSKVYYKNSKQTKKRNAFRHTTQQFWLNWTFYFFARFVHWT